MIVITLWYINLVWLKVTYGYYEIHREYFLMYIVQVQAFLIPSQKREANVNDVGLSGTFDLYVV